ncbi:MAG: DUF3810 domain-containing protein [Gemmatimonadaceae bacterium]|nr:DUF3810 domain-containing protein [Chitinophagaceae bacterium]
MHLKRKAWLIVLLLILVIRIFSNFPEAVERYYSTGLYPLISGLQRILFGWIPFSIGDILYALTAIVLLVRLIKFLKTVFRKQATRLYWRNSLLWLVFTALMVYCFFNLVWGLNYNRIGVAQQLELKMDRYTTEELAAVMSALAVKLDSLAPRAATNRAELGKKRNLFKGALQAYNSCSKDFSFLTYKNPSVKPSLFSYLGDYMGYTGYYNPFSGEAQVNTTVPVFVQPFTACHEIGHQLGYAKENEANFAGYLSARSSADQRFRYSVYFDMFLYGIGELTYRDSTVSAGLRKKLPAQVKKDVAELRKFYKAYENPIEPYIRQLYAQYLRANQQPSGMKSYNEVMAFLVAYYKKYGAESL